MLDGWTFWEKGEKEASQEAGADLSRGMARQRESGISSKAMRYLPVFLVGMTFTAAIAQDRQRRITDEQMRQRAPEGVLLQLDVPYREGHELWKLDLAMPEIEVEKPRPAIVVVHGGGWVQGDKRTEAFVEQTLDYAARGYVAVNVNYRLDRAIRPCVEDVKCAVRWLRAHATEYDVDPDRIGAYGNSAGAHLVAMLGLSHREKRLDAGPWQEYSSAVQAVAGSATPTRPRIRGGSDADRALVAPMTYVSADAPPFLLFHEASDNVVNVSDSDDFVRALKEAGATDITYKRYTDGTGHGVFRANLEETEPEMERFFARTLRVRSDGLVAANAADPNAKSLSPGQLFSVYSEITLSGREEAAMAVPLPEDLAGVSATLSDSAGVEHALILLYVGPNQLNGYLSEDTTVGPATLTINAESGAVLQLDVMVIPVSPGLFSADGSGTGLAATIAVRVGSDGSQTVVNALRVENDAVVGVPLDVSGGDLVLLLYGTGFRNGAVVEVLFNGERAQVVGRGPSSEYLGLDQVNVRLDSNLAGSGGIDIQLLVDGIPTNTVTVSIK